MKCIYNITTFKYSSMSQQLSYELKIERPESISEEETEVIDDSEQAFAEIFQARQRTFEKFLEVAEQVNEITKVQTKLNVSGGVLSLVGTSHFYQSFELIFRSL